MNNTQTDLALLFIRIGLAAVFMVHGYEKVTALAGTVAFFSKFGIAPLWAYVVTGTELVGGLMLLLGILANWAGVALAVDMAVAIVLVKHSKGFVGGYEFDLVLFLSALSIALAGPGRYVLKSILRRG